MMSRMQMAGHPQPRPRPRQTAGPAGESVLPRRLRLLAAVLHVSVPRADLPTFTLRASLCLHGGLWPNCVTNARHPNCFNNCRSSSKSGMVPPPAFPASKTASDLLPLQPRISVKCEPVAIFLRCCASLRAATLIPPAIVLDTAGWQKACSSHCSIAVTASSRAAASDGFRCSGQSGNQLTPSNTPSSQHEREPYGNPSTTACRPLTKHLWLPCTVLAVLSVGRTGAICRWQMATARRRWPRRRWVPRPWRALIPLAWQQQRQRRRHRLDRCGQVLWRRRARGRPHRRPQHLRCPAVGSLKKKSPNMWHCAPCAFAHHRQQHTLRAL